MPAKGSRKLFCLNGHARTPENVNAKRQCLECLNPYHRQYRRNHIHSTRAAQRKYRYGLSKEQYNALLEAQNNRCAICEREFSWDVKKTSPHVDHDHISGRVRSLLCDYCNKAIGNFEDSIESVRKAVKYLEMHKARLENE